LGDKRKEGFTINRCIDTRVQCPAKVHICLRYITRQKVLNGHQVC